MPSPSYPPSYPPSSRDQAPLQSGERRSVVLFDGVCNLCNRSVLFVIDRDPHGHFAFAPLQSDEGQRLLAAYAPGETDLSSVVLVEGGRAYTRSTAALRIARRLTGLWPLLRVFFLVPRPLRDGVYDWIARNRYRWFGREDACRVPTPELRARFLA
jgi:predicted DCC family thiol-disulfide oxidoreductase YuxK